MILIKKNKTFIVIIRIFQTEVSTSRPISEVPGFKNNDVNQYEEEYEKILDHVRLSNDSFKPHTEAYYSKRMHAFANEGKVIII